VAEDGDKIRRRSKCDASNRKDHDLYEAIRRKTLVADEILSPKILEQSRAPEKVLSNLDTDRMISLKQRKCDEHDDVTDEADVIAEAESLPQSNGYQAAWNEQGIQCRSCQTCQKVRQKKVCLRQTLEDGNHDRIID